MRILIHLHYRSFLQHYGICMKALFLQIKLLINLTHFFRSLLLLVSSLLGMSGLRNLELRIRTRYGCLLGNLVSGGLNGSDLLLALCLDRLCHPLLGLRETKILSRTSPRRHKLLARLGIWLYGN